MTTKLDGFKYSTCPQRVQLVLKELGVDYDFKDVNLKESEHKVVGRNLLLRESGVKS